MASKQQLENAVAEAAAELDEQLHLSEKQEEPSAEVQLEAESEEDEESPEEGGEDEEDDSSHEADEAQRLYQALKDPKAAPMIIAALAQNMGLSIAPTETKKEQKSDIKSVQSLLKEGLGKEYEFLADRLGPAIERVLDQEREQQEARFESQRRYQIEQQVVSATDKLSQQTKGDSKKYEARMTVLAEEIAPGNMTMDTYIRRLYNIAKSETNGLRVAPPNPKRNADRVRQNANNAPERLKGASTRVEPANKVPDKKMSLTESVNYALTELSNRR